MNGLTYLLLLGVMINGFGLMAQTKETITIKTNIYCDHCKQCESCGPRIYNQVMDVPGVRKVKIMEENASVIVTYNSDKLDPKAIRDAINDAGFFWLKFRKYPWSFTHSSSPQTIFLNI